MKKVTTSIVYENKNKKVFENRKMVKLKHNNINNSQKILNSNFTNSKKKSMIKDKDILKSEKKNEHKILTNRESSLKKIYF